MRFHSFHWTLALALLVNAGGSQVLADDMGITVLTVGEVKVKPTHVELNLQTAGLAELTGDAIAKYRDAKRRTVEAFNSLKIKNLSVEEQGLSLVNSAAGGMPGMMAMVAGGQAPAAKPQVEISRNLRVVLKDIQAMSEDELMETIARILDTAKDSGATVGASQANSMMARMMGQQMPGSLVTFVLDNTVEVRERAYKQAMDQARDRAGRLAKLASVKLGPVVSVQETAVTSGGETAGAQQMMMAMYGMGEAAGKEELRAKSDKFEEIAVRVSLQVRFAIER
jgi:uncharacterized protein YggE